MLERRQYHDAAGNTSTIFVLDTGIEVNHRDFGGRAWHGVTIPVGQGDMDGNGHGTWVAGIAAGATYGVAKEAHVVAVKVFNDAGYGSTSDVIAGIDWVVQHHDGSVTIIILALGGSASPSLDAAVDAAVDAGVHVVTSAGSSGSDACNFSPGRNPKVVNAFGTDANDSMASGSNHGPCGTRGCPAARAHA